MVIAMRAIFVALLVHRHVLPERLLALFAHECHLRRFCEAMRFGFGVAFCTVEPLLAARRTYRDLSIQDVFAATKHGGRSD